MNFWELNSYWKMFVYFFQLHSNDCEQFYMTLLIINIFPSNPILFKYIIYNLICGWNRTLKKSRNYIKNLFNQMKVVEQPKPINWSGNCFEIGWRKTEQISAGIIEKFRNQSFVTVISEPKCYLQFI